MYIDMTITVTLQHGIQRIRGDPALIVLVSDHHDVTIVAPILAPAAGKRNNEVALFIKLLKRYVYLFFTSQ